MYYYVMNNLICQSLFHITTTTHATSGTRDMWFYSYESDKLETCNPCSLSPSFTQTHTCINKEKQQKQTKHDFTSVSSFSPEYPATLPISSGNVNRCLPVDKSCICNSFYNRKKAHLRSLSSLSVEFNILAKYQ